MGCFDEVVFDCPGGCGERLGIQTKAGECSMSTFPADDVPMMLAADVDGQTTYCAVCDKMWRLTLPFGPRARMLVVLV